MRVETLPSPGLLSNGIRIRIEAAKAISAVEINAGYSGGTSPAAKPLSDFFDACKTALSTLLDVVVPTVAARSIAPSAATRLTITHSEGLNPANVPDAGDFAIAGQVKTVQKVTIDGPFVHLDVATPFVAGAVTVAYTQSGTAAKRLQDLSGNLVASYAATAVTNGIV